jgi:WD40 repeat protein
VDAGKERRQISDAMRGGSGWNRVALSHDGKTLALAGYPQPIRLFDTTTGALIRQIAADGTAAPAGRAPNSRFLPYRVELSSDAKTLFLAGIDIGGAAQTPVLAIWDAAAGKELKRIDKIQNNNGRNLTYKAAVTADLKTAALPCPDEILVYDMVAGKELRKIKYNADYRTNLAFTADGKTLMAVTGKADALTAWDVADGKLLRQVGTSCRRSNARADPPRGRTACRRRNR